MSKVVGSLNGISLRIEQRGARAVKGVSDIMQDNAERIRDLAIEYAPVLTGDLEKTIRKNTSYTGINRRAIVEVFIDENGPAGDYARLVHEGLAPFGSGETGRVGGSDPESLSVRKDAGRGVVGGKFLTRAYREFKDKLTRDARRVIERAFR
ncbi:hypothetical protein [Methylobacillus sp.]|uniref:hypothetical protein n=1 Tax=Methylobacillus sp. TaxID=56818 RepID=UPI00257C5E24|nr:hypothetical protein [Methylobacillus sp.]